MPAFRFQFPAVFGLTLAAAASAGGCGASERRDPPDAVADAVADAGDAASDAALDGSIDAAVDAAPAPGPFALRLRGADGARPADLHGFVAINDGEVAAFDCMADAPATQEWSVTCTPEGLTFPNLMGAPAHLEMTLKAAGHRSVRIDRTDTDLAFGGADIALPPLPAPEQTADYATGFAPGTGPDALLPLAFQSAGELGRASVVKWYLEGLGNDSPSLWLINTAAHPIHFDFVRDVLGRALTNADFEAATYRNLPRQAMAGSLVSYPDLASDAAPSPLTIEYFPNDTLTPGMAIEAYLRLEERLPFVSRAAGAAGGLFYVPAGTLPEADAEAAARTFALAGARVLPQRALYAGIGAQYLNPGVAFGTLRLLTPEQLDSEVVSFEDIVVLPRLPNEMPLVGGTISAELQTPLAHVNVAARARNTPNLALVDAPTDPRVAPLLGKLVRFEVAPGRFSLSEATRAEAEAFWRDRRDRPPFAPSADLSRTGLLSLDALFFDDASAVGVKAANVAELHHVLGDAAPNGFAVPFAEYHRFMTETPVGAGACADAETDCLEEGRDAAVCSTARGLCEPAEQGAEVFAEWIARAEADAAFDTDAAVREATLDGLRWVMRHTEIAPDLAAALDAEVLRLFGDAPVRLRSSTNAEDLDRFTGAGLYDSTTAYAAGAERASREIRKIWASCWNWRAYEERAFWNVTHDAVQVGVLVQDAFPDEQVNGVLITQNLSDPRTRGFYVNAQQGETSVTNPTDGALPEIFSIVIGPGGAPEVVRARFSSLSPDGPLLENGEVEDLFQAALAVQTHFAPLYGQSAATLALDIEWKLSGPARRLVLKQVRPYAVPEGG